MLQDRLVDMYTLRTVNGAATSLSDVGFNRIGIDDNWQSCNSTDSTRHADGHYFHNDTAPMDGQLLIQQNFQIFLV